MSKRLATAVMGATKTVETAVQAGSCYLRRKGRAAQPATATRSTLGAQHRAVMKAMIPEMTGPPMIAAALMIPVLRMILLLIRASKVAPAQRYLSALELRLEGE
jgi:hypothetical protein